MGSGQIIKCFGVKSELWNLLGHLNTDEIRNTLYSEEFFKLKLKLPNGKLASTFFEIIPDKQFIAYDTNRVSRLEIKSKNKVRSKIFFKEIISQELLFPLYNYRVEKLIPFQEKGIIIFENDIGHFGKCKLDQENFEIDRLSFNLINIEILSGHMVLKIYYNNEELIFKKRDSLFNGGAIVLKV